MDRFLGEYVPVAGEAMERHGGRVLVSTPDPDVIEGNWDHTLTFLAEFPAVEDAEARYIDEGHQVAKEARQGISEYTQWIHASEFSPEDVA